MTDFLLLYTGGGMPETEEETQVVMEEWGAWYGTMGDALKDGGSPTSPVAKGIASDGSVSDEAPVSGVSGYTIIAADSMDEAVEIAKGCPILKSGGRISVFETFPVM